MKRAFRKNMAIADIKIGNDRRPIHYEAVKGIAESFKLIGQLHPITVDEDDVLRAGLHRLEAAKLCEWKTIEATIIESGPEADLAEADENLQRHGLDALQFARSVAQRKRAWEEIHGKIKRGPKKKGSDISDNLSEIEADRPTFVEETAAMHGLSTRTVERGMAIGEGLTEEAVEILEDSKLADNATALAAIASAPAEQQAEIAREAVEAGKVELPTAAVDAVFDALKGPVSKSVAPVFVYAEEWKKLYQALTNCKSMLTKIKDHETACWLDEQETTRLIGQAQTNVKFAMPYTECPKCRRKVKKECSCCKGRGWITSSIFKANASDPDKAWLQARK